MVDPLLQVSPGGSGGGGGLGDTPEACGGAGNTPPANCSGAGPGPVQGYDGGS